MEVRSVRDRDEADAALDLAERIWGVRPIATPMLRALEFAGIYLSIALDESRLVGMCGGFAGLREPGRWHLHSHLAAVDPAVQGRGVGTMLKRHQRDWCLARDIGHVSWTFDPLVAVNARFNLHRLGALGVGYEVNLYGAMDDDVNRGDESDRILVDWDLTSPRAEAALHAPLPAPSTAELGRADGLVLVAVPADAAALRRTDVAEHRRWRHRLRDALAGPLSNGYRLEAVTDDGHYVLRRIAP